MNKKFKLLYWAISIVIGLIIDFAIGTIAIFDISTSGNPMAFSEFNYAILNVTKNVPGIGYIINKSDSGEVFFLGLPYLVLFMLIMFLVYKSYSKRSI